ncbi:DEAD/DEAH box helicase [Mycobacterium sp.]|uniref:DEAD/DEAH box helicase n=1 Tax=Mycobacterium sp. TaxID=1785 RepID=UPI0025D2F65E|nr:DEAD/DEAH box helicase [Mycobacterium sp.]
MTDAAGDGERLRLRPYQAAAVDVVDTAHERALVVAACGTGKTLIAVHTVAKLLNGAPGAVLVVFPTLGLLEQTYRTWARQATFSFTALGVCSARLSGTEDIGSEDLSIPSTTSPQLLAEWRAGLVGSGVVFCTYQSLPVITAAHHDHGMAPWSIAVFDEAHRTAGLQGKPFAVALDSAKIPARQRLFYTATPKIHSGTRTRGGNPHRRTVASMDDSELYGHQVFTLSAREAIDQGILSPFKVAVIAVSDSAVSAALKDLQMISLAAGETNAARAEHVAAAIALTEAAADYDLSSVLAFHNTIAASAEFATTFRRVHALLSAQGFNRDGRAAGVVHIDGNTKLHDRLAATRTLAEPRAGQWNIVTNARCLTEGINIPALDAVLFAEPRSSEVDVAQAVGRAIRKNPHHDRPALIVLAVTVDDSQDAETVIDISQFRGTRQVLKALQTHDPSLTRDLAALRDQLDNPRDGDTGDVKTDILDIHLPATLTKQLADQFFRAFSIHTVDALTRQWEENYYGAREFAGKFGHTNIPRRYLSTNGLAVGQWAQHQRSLHNRGRLLAERADRLEALAGWEWDPRDTQWEFNLVALQQFIAEYGHSFPAGDYRSPDGVNVGIWTRNQRTAHLNKRMPARRVQRLESLPGWSWSRPDTRWGDTFAELEQHLQQPGATYPSSGTVLGRWVFNQRGLFRRQQLDAQRAEMLAALPGWTWNVLDTQWDDNIAALSAYVAASGHARPPQSHVTDSGFQLGRWVSDQRRQRRRLSDERRAQLQAMPGWTWNSREAQWEDFIAKLAAFADEHGHSYPPRDPARPDLVKLNQTVISIRRPERKNRLSPEQRRQLEALPGWSWEPRQKSTWDDTFAALAAFADEHGHAAPPIDHCTPEGIPLGRWVHQMRQPSRRRKLGAKQVARLEALTGWSWD